MKYFVYVHIFPNGKQYVGMTKSTEKRWRNGRGYEKNKRMFSDIQKFGWENIKHIVLYEDLSFDEASKLEIEETIKRKSNNEKFGYNTIIGRSQSKEKNPMYGMSGIKSPVSIPVFQYDTETLEFIKGYDTALKASLELKINNHINECCRGERLSCGGYYWSYEKKDKYEKIRDKRKDTSKNRSVVQIGTNGEIIKIYNSITEAKKETGANNISDCCRGVRKISNGYKWRYLDEIN